MYTFTRNDFKTLDTALTYDDVSLVPSESLDSVSTPNLTTRLTRDIFINKPIVSANMDTVTEAPMAIAMHRMDCFGIIHRNMSITEQVNQVLTVKNCNIKNIGVGIGVKQTEYERAEKIIEAGANVIVVDIAHGHSNAMINMIKWLKNNFKNIQVIAGNVATAEATCVLADAGADAIKVGIGPGSLCTTRLKTGCGVPQLTAIATCSLAADTYNIPVIADGGIRVSGDIVKAFAAGASTVMIGNLFAGTNETPGEIKNGMKEYRGMASLAARAAREGAQAAQRTAEGESTFVPIKGSVCDIVTDLYLGICSGMSYLSATHIQNVRNAIFQRVTLAAVIEASAHGLRK